MFNFQSNPFLQQEIATLILLLLAFFSKYISSKLVRKIAKKNESLEHRTNLIIKYINIIIFSITALVIIVIWGVDKQQIFLFLSSLFTVIGVAFFAQWSLLSNITSGILLFISFPFKIGDRIKILDKDFPIEAEIIDIKAFYIILKTDDEETVTYPNSLLMQKGIALLKPLH